MSKQSANINLTGIGSILIVISVWILAFVFQDGKEGPFLMAGTLFSGLAFAGVVWTVLMQKEELRQQRKELELTREVFKDQGKTQNKQRFENTFFQLVAVHNQKASNFQYGSARTSAAAFTHVYGEVKGRASQLKGPEAMNYAYGKIKSEGTILDIIPYENNLFNLLSFVRNSDLIDDSERRFYVKVLAGQLSNGEMQLMWLEANTRKESDTLEAEGFFDTLSDPLLPKRGGTAMIIK